MMLELTPDEAEALGNPLESYLCDLRMEITGTDSCDYRNSLKERQNLLEHVRQQAIGTAAGRVSTLSSG